MQYKETYTTEFTEVNTVVLYKEHFCRTISNMTSEKNAISSIFYYTTPRCMGVYMLKRMRTPGVKVRLFIVQVSISCLYDCWFTLWSVIF